MDAPWINKAHITQILKFQYAKCVGNCEKKHILKQHIYPICNLWPLKENDTFLHLLSCCTNQHKNWHNKVVHVVHPTTVCFIPIHNKLNNKTHTISRQHDFLPSSCYLPRCTCSAELRMDMLCILGTSPLDQSPLHQTLTLSQILEVRYFNDRFPQDATRRLEKYNTLLT